MTEERKEKLISLGVDLDETLERFVENEDLYIRCLSKLIDDKNFSNMCDAIEAKDPKSAFEYAHALKGVTANLGLSKVFKEMKELTEVFRAGSLDFEYDNYDRLKCAYDEAIETIKLL